LVKTLNLMFEVLCPYKTSCDNGLTRGNPGVDTLSNTWGVTLSIKLARDIPCGRQDEQEGRISYRGVEAQEYGHGDGQKHDGGGITVRNCPRSPRSAFQLRSRTATLDDGDPA
jgi:hypothetical protein